MTTSASALTGAGTDAHSGTSGLVRNRGSVAVYIGNASVTSSTGYQLDAGEAVPLDLFDDEVLYGITASGSAVCHVIETGV